MKTGIRIKDTVILVFLGIVFVALALFLLGLLIPEAGLSLAYTGIAACFAGLFLSPLFFWFTLKARAGGGIDAAPLSDMELNERDIREAVSNWIHIHYGKKLEGELEFYKDNAGILNCRASVRDEF